jgi:hypothetical protein
VLNIATFSYASFLLLFAKHLTAEPGSLWGKKIKLFIFLGEWR